MVIYDFKCPRGYVFEERRRMGNTGPAVCPKCGGDAEKLISAPCVVMNWHDSDSLHESKRFRAGIRSSALRGGNQ